MNLLDKDAEWVKTKPGNVIIFDPRTIHTGSDFEQDKYSVFVAYGRNNIHFQQHYQYYRFLRKDLNYKELSPKLVDQLKVSDLYGGEEHTMKKINGAWIPSDIFNYFAGFF